MFFELDFELNADTHETPEQIAAELERIANEVREGSVSGVIQADRVQLGSWQLTEV